MTVYLAICDYGYEGPSILAVCSTRELAQQRIDMRHRCAAQDHCVEEWQVDGPNDQQLSDQPVGDASE